MVNRNRLVLCLLFSFIVPCAAKSEVVKTLRTQFDVDVRHDYYIGLLQQALIKGANGREVPLLEQTSFMDQERAAYELNRGKLIDIYWMGTNISREQKLRAIRIPLERGLIGYRSFIIRADQHSDFDAIAHAAASSRLGLLKRKVACQGLGWPDVDIMRAAGLHVITSPGFEELYKRLAAGRCDYFPRGYFEVESELNDRASEYPSLQHYPSLVLHYTFPIYFFVKKDNEALAQWIEQGLEKMIDTGELLAYMKNHPLTSHVFPLNKKSASQVVIDIPNPYLSADTDYSNARYWFQPADFGQVVEQKPNK